MLSDADYSAMLCPEGISLALEMKKELQKLDRRWRRSQQRWHKLVVLVGEYRKQHRAETDWLARIKLFIAQLISLISRR